MQTPRRFLGFIVGGESLEEHHGFDLILLPWLVRACRRTRRPHGGFSRDESSDLDDRVAVYVCLEDADLLCGALSAIAERQSPESMWRVTG